MTRVIAIGDIMGKAGRRALERLLPKARLEFEPDFVLVNGENAAGGFGLTEKIYKAFVGGMAIDAVTMGNHWHDKREIYDYRATADRLVLPANMGNIDREEYGLKIIRTKRGVDIAVMNVIGRAFMVEGNRDPFKAIEKLLDQIPAHVRLKILDIHAEATSEKQALGWYFAKRLSLIYGTHSHVATADERIMEGHAGYVTDLGMTGGYDSVIGIRKDSAIARMMTGEKKKFEPANGDPWLCFIVADLDDDTGCCTKVTRYRWELSESADERGADGED